MDPIDWNLLLASTPITIPIFCSQFYFNNNKFEGKKGEMKGKDKSSSVICLQVWSRV